MNKRELTKKIATEAGIPQIKAAAALDSAVDLIVGTVANGGKVQIHGFGTFAPIRRKARKGRDPHTGATIDIPPTTVPLFRAGRAFKDACKE